MKLKLQLVEDGTPTVSMSVHDQQGKEIASQQIAVGPTQQDAVAAEIHQAFADIKTHGSSAADLFAVLGGHFGALATAEPRFTGAAYAAPISDQTPGLLEGPLTLELGATHDPLEIRSDNGNLDADKLAQLYDFTTAEMAAYVGVTRQALAKKTDSERYQEKLATLETIAGVMPHLGNEPKAFRIWLKKPQRGIGNTTPRELILAGKADDVENAVTRMLSGEPS